MTISARRPARPFTVAVIVALQLACAVEPPTSDRVGWPTYGGQPSGTQYSPLDQVNLTNVDRLEVAWTYRSHQTARTPETARGTVDEVTPIFVDGRLFLCTTRNNLVALHPGTGVELWRVDPIQRLTDSTHGPRPCRGVSYWEAEAAERRTRPCGKRIFATVGDGWLVAVDATTGESCVDFGRGGGIDLNELDYKGEGRVSSTSPPAIYQHAVIVGGSISDNKWRDSPDGIVRGFDARSGEQLWHWNPIPDHLSDQVGGANTWAPMAIDQDRGWVFLPTGSPSYDVYGVNRTDPIPFGNAVVVLDALTGKVIWSFQTVYHDLWDYDLPSMPTLAIVEQDGKRIPAVLQATKTGHVFVLDRLTGQPLFPVEEVPVPQTDVPGEYSSPTQPVPLVPAPVASQELRATDGWGVSAADEAECRGRLETLRNDGLYTPPSLRGSILHPSFLGGTNWGGIAYDERSGLAVTNSSNAVASAKLMPRDDYDPDEHKKPGVFVYEMQGSPFLLLREVLLSSSGLPCNPPPWGLLTAIDMGSGEIRWQVPFGQTDLGALGEGVTSPGGPNMGGPIMTGGDLVFIGASTDGRFRAFDSRTGVEVWSAEIPAPATSTPMTYLYGPNERQYVVVSAGGGSQPDTSDAIVAFALRQ